jgi:hypothetical protein
MKPDVLLIAVWLIVAGGCGCTAVDPAQVAEDAWRLDDEEGTLAALREAFPEAESAVSERRQMMTLNWPPTYVWAAVATLPSGHRIEATRIVKIADDGGGAAEGEELSFAFLAPVSDPLWDRDSEQARRSLAAEEVRRIAAARGERAALAELGIELDLAPPDQAALRDSLCLLDPSCDALCAALPEADVHFVRQPFSREGRCFISVGLGPPADEHGLRAYTLHWYRGCTLSDDGRRIESLADPGPGDLKLQHTTTRWEQDGHGGRHALHDTLDVYLSNEQLAEIVAARGETAVLERLVAEERRERGAIEKVTAPGENDSSDSWTPHP